MAAALHLIFVQADPQRSFERGSQEFSVCVGPLSTQAGQVGVVAFTAFLSIFPGQHLSHGLDAVVPHILINVGFY